MHHGLAPHGSLLRDHIWGASRLRQALLEMGAQLVLSGHGHFPHTRRIEEDGRSLLWVQAGSAGSPRLAPRCSRNSLNVVRAAYDRLVVEWWYYVEKLGAFELEATVEHPLGEPAGP